VSRFGTLRVIEEGKRALKNGYIKESKTKGVWGRIGRNRIEMRGKKAMQKVEPSAESEKAERERVEAVVETLGAVRTKGETLAEVAHDARNMVTALGLYCDLLEEPGVLDTQFVHYGTELRLVAAASRRLVEKLMVIDSSNATSIDSFNRFNEPVRSLGTLRAPRKAGVRISRLADGAQLPPRAIESFAGELVANRNLLASLVGPSVSLTVDVEGGALPVKMAGEELTRVLVNLVKNAAESMPAGGCITLGLHEFHAGADAAPWLVLTVEDNGPGIPYAALKTVFEAGYTTHSNGEYGKGEWPGAHRGLGLSITRSILAAAGGSIRAVNRDSGGGRFVIELPVRTE